jgi:uncharacterized membrane protein YraQ (UPF0718 family)
MNINLFLQNFLMLLLDAAPWLVVGLLIGSLIKTLVPTSWLEKHLKGESLWSVMKAALFGAPLPLCSCGVLPAALGLRKAGASKAATTSFLVSTPETGVDSVMVTYALLGPIMAITRPVVAILSAITAGLLVGNTKQLVQKKILGIITDSEKIVSSSCCSSHHSEVPTNCCSNTQKATATESDYYSFIDEKEASACCSTDSSSQDAKSSSAIIARIHYAFTELLDGIIFWMLIGLLFSAGIQTWVSSDFLAQWGSGLPAMLVMIVISIPMYVCATASTPLAAGLMMSGISPGTVLVFLLAGPASNIGSLGVIKKELGKRALIAYLSGVSIVAIISGLLLDWLISHNAIDIQAQISSSETMLPLWLSWVGLIIILIASGQLLLKHYHSRRLVLQQHRFNEHSK